MLLVFGVRRLNRLQFLRGTLCYGNRALRFLRASCHASTLLISAQRRLAASRLHVIRSDFPEARLIARQEL
jgi:hypothetical protein